MTLFNNKWHYILGQLYDVAWGQKLFKKCHGKGPPTGKQFIS